MESINDTFIWLSPLLGIGVIQGLILVAVLIFVKKGNRKANIILAIFVFIYSGDLFTSFSVYTGWYTYFPHLILVFYPLSRLIGPTFFFYTILLMNSERKFKWYDTLHCLPMIYICYDAWPFFMLSTSSKISAISSMWSVEHTFTAQVFVMFLIWSAHTIIYVLISIYYLNKNIQELKNFSANTHIGFMDWIKQLASVYLSLLTLQLVVMILSYIFAITPGIMEAITQLIMALFIYYLVFIAIGQPEMFYFSSASTKSKSSEEKELNNEIAFEQLTKLMKEKHPYLDPNLRVHNLAAMLNVTPHVVSKAINMKASVNFYDFVNTYRIEEFKKRVTSKGYEHLTLLGIAYDVGFNSKTSFNRIFKNHTGLTPSEYIKIK